MSQRIISCLCLAVFLFSFSSCVSGRINTLANGTHKENATFYVIQNDKQSLTDRHIQDLITKEMEKLRFTPASSQGAADYLVTYNFQMGAGSTEVMSLQGSIYSATIYPREFVIIIIDNSLGAPSKDVPNVLWQAELYSKGSGSDMSELADVFIPQMFQRYGKTVTNEEFQEQ